VSKLALQQDNGKFFPTVPYVTNVSEGVVVSTVYHTMGGRDKDPEKAKRNIGLRCCSANDTMCTSWSNNFWALLDRGCSNNGRAIHGKPMTYSEAEAFCKAMNQDLCSEDMLSKEMTRDERKCKRTKFGGYWVRACPGGCRFSGCWHEDRNMYAKDLE